MRIELTPALAEFAGSAHAKQLERRLESELGALLERVELAGSIDAGVTIGSSRRLARIYVHERLLPYPPDLLRRAWLAVSPEALRHLPDAEQRADRPGFAAAWLCEYATSAIAGAEPPDFGLLAAFIQRLATQAVLDRPSCLVGPAQVEEYGSSLGGSQEGQASLLRTLLDMGVSLEDRELVRTIVREGEEIGRPLEDTIEAVFTELRPHRIEIVVHSETLAELAPESTRRTELSVYDQSIDETRRDLFQNFERVFSSTFGFLLPSIVWVPSGALAERTVAVRIGTWRSLPVPMPPDNFRLVLAPSEELSGIDARPSFDPVSGMPCSIVSTEVKDELERLGFTTWGPVDFSLVILWSELSRRVTTLLGVEEIEYQLAQLPAEPDRLLTDTSLVALTRFSLGDLTRVMRALVGEHLSMLDLSGLLERLVQYDTIEIGDELEEPLILDDRLPISTNGGPQTPAWRSYYAFLRHRLKPYLSYFHSDSDMQILALSLEPELEELARRAVDELDDDRLEAFRDGVWEELFSLAPSTTHVIVTTTRARHPVRDLLATEFPDLPILAYCELTPDVDLQWLGRITAVG